jgi:hypothetical protein
LTAVEEGLAVTSAGGGGINQLFTSLPTEAADAFRLLMELSREDADLRQSIVSLAAFAEPAEPFRVTQIIGPDTPLPQRPTSQEISDSPSAQDAGSRSTTSASRPSKPTAKLVKLRTNIMPVSDQKVAEKPESYKTRKKNGTED